MLLSTQEATRQGQMGGSIMLEMTLLMIQYLLSPVAFLLTFILPIVFFLANRRYVWCSIPLAVLAELIIHWGDFSYYESRGLMILVTCVQVAVMAILIFILKSFARRRKK